MTAITTRAELKEALGRSVTFDTLDGQRMMRLVMRAELNAIICSGPRRGKQFTYALLDERAPAVPVRDRDEDLLDLTLRYFNTRSPATAHDFAWWSGLTMRDVKRGMEIAGTQLEKVVIDGREYGRAGPPPAVPSASAHLLPNYDEFFIGYRDRSAIGRRLASVKAVTGGNALIAHVVAVGGQLVGGWKRVNGKTGIELRLSLLTSLTRAESVRVRQAVKRFTQFAGQPVAVSGLRVQASVPAPPPGQGRRPSGTRPPDRTFARGPR